MDASQNSTQRVARRLIAAALLVLLVAVAIVVLGPGPDPSLRATAAGGGPAVRLEFTAPEGARTVELFRDGRLLDRVGAGSGTWTDRLLWPDTDYRYVARFMDGDDEQLRLAATARTARGRWPARRFAGEAWVNAPLDPAAALDSGSGAMVARAVAPEAARANLANSAEWGIPVAYAGEASPRSKVGCERFFCEVGFPPQRIPAYAAPSSGSDRHLAVIDEAAGTELDMWLARRDGDGFTAGSRWVLPAGESALNCPGDGPCGGAIAANLPLTAGAVRPEEIAAGRIPHALAITLPATRSGPPACPAAGSDGATDDPAAIPIGARLRLPPDADIGALGLSPWQAAIARALQEYGAYVVDTGGSLAVRAESTRLRGYDAWNRAGVTADDPSLSAIPWSRLQVLALRSCPDRG